MTKISFKIHRVGYARVSTYDQTLNAQLEQLRGAGCGHVYCEKTSKAQADRRELQRMLMALAPGDVVTVTRIDRLARSTFDLFGLVKRRADGATLKELASSYDVSKATISRLSTSMPSLSQVIKVSDG